MTIALIHEWIEKAGGAERVLDVLVQMYPDSELYCLWNDDPDRFGSRSVTETWLSRSPLRHSKIASLPFMEPAWRSLSTETSLDFALISTHLFAHHARFSTQPDLPKYAYVHTPARYIWSPELDPRGKSLPARIASPVLRTLDRRRALELDKIAANSAFVRDRIRDTWNRDAEIIFPPVAVERILSVSDWAEELTEQEAASISHLPSEFILGASRFVSYKGLDRVIDFAAAVDRPVVLAGSGPEHQRLSDHASEAGVQLFFVHRPEDAVLYTLYQRAAAYVFPAVEDFGIMPVEALAAGGRVIVNRVGGTSETVVDGHSGVHLSEFSGDDAREAFESVDRIVKSAARERADAFSTHRFRENLTSWIGSN